MVALAAVLRPSVAVNCDFVYRG